MCRPPVECLLQEMLSGIAHPDSRICQTPHTSWSGHKVLKSTQTFHALLRCLRVDCLFECTVCVTFVFRKYKMGIKSLETNFLVANDKLCGLQNFVNMFTSTLYSIEKATLLLYSYAHVCLSGADDCVACEKKVSAQCFPTRIFCLFS